MKAAEEERRREELEAAEEERRREELHKATLAQILPAHDLERLSKPVHSHKVGDPTPVEVLEAEEDLLKSNPTAFMTTLKPDTPEEVLEAKEDLLKSNPTVFNTKTWKPMRGKPMHIHMIDHSWPTSCRDPTETSRWLSTTSCTPHIEDQSGPITTHTSIPKEHESSFLPPLYPCKRPTISPESPCPLQPSTSSYKGPHRAPTPLWLQGYNYSPRNTHS
ncbi:Uncharacterized protein FKW44_010259 [Caligus rogercresseyi]|uniref:Uncharacterized protein n=1 Tax=Caligus rogercresseyi TaxID=217165 RepID=A0A7T8HGR3_CALRO|nr:Uncharacterized protein FKW44_010259 [Caligus rogercresseyi]